MESKLDYKPNRTPEQLALERLVYNQSLTYTQRFEKMMQLIKINMLLKKAKITHC